MSILPLLLGVPAADASDWIPLAVHHEPGDPYSTIIGEPANLTDGDFNTGFGVELLRAVGQDGPRLSFSLMPAAPKRIRQLRFTVAVGGTPARGVTVDVTISGLTFTLLNDGILFEGQVLTLAHPTGGEFFVDSAMTVRLDAFTFSPDDDAAFKPLGFAEMEVVESAPAPTSLILGLSSSALSLNPEGWYGESPLKVALTATCSPGSSSTCLGELRVDVSSAQDAARFYLVESSFQSGTCAVAMDAPAHPDVGHVSTRRYSLSCPGFALPSGQSMTHHWNLWVQPSEATQLDIRASWLSEQASQSVAIPAAEIHPLVLIHGIQGSQPPGNELVTDDQRMFRRLDPFNGYYWPLLINLQKMGYEWNKTLFALAYDWRHTNRFSGAFLAEQLRTAVIPRSNAAEIGYVRRDGKTDLIVHSMGGLVSRAYLQNEAVEPTTAQPVPYQGDVNKVIFVATPHKGFPFTYETWENMDWTAYMEGAGSLPGAPSIFATMMNQRIWPSYVGKHYAPNQVELETKCAFFPGPPPVPLGRYVKVGFKGSVLGTFLCDKNTYAGWAHDPLRGIRSLFEMLPADDTPRYLYDRDGVSPGPVPPELNTFLSILNENAGDELEGALLEPQNPADVLGNHVFAIYGDGAPETDLGYIVDPAPAGTPNLWRRGEVVSDIPVRDAGGNVILGDNLIPSLSACLTCGDEPLLPGLSPENDAVLDASPSAPLRARHSALMYHPETQKKWVPMWLAGYDVEIPFHTGALTPLVPVSGSLAVITQCPVNLLVTDPQGRRLGFDPASGQVVREIENAVYTEPGLEPQIVLIGDPVDGSYRITATGYDTDLFTVEASFIDGGGIRRLGFFGEETTPAQQHSFEFRMDGTVSYQPPVAEDDDFEVSPGASVLLDVLANDTVPQSGTPPPYLLSGPAHGSAQVEGFRVRYMPEAGYAGPDEIRYGITDGLAESTARVSLLVKPASGILAVDDDAATAEDTEEVIHVLANDIGQNLRVLSVGEPLPAGSGSVSNHQSLVIFTPAPNFSGLSQFTYTMGDGASLSSATVRVQVVGINDPPLAVADRATTARDQSVTIAVLANDLDPENQALSIVSLGPAANGTVTASGGTVLYTPAAGFLGFDEFTYRVGDPLGATAAGRVSVAVVDPSLASPAPGALWEIPVVVISYLPTADGLHLDPSLTGSSETLAVAEGRIAEMNVQVKFMLEEGSRFRAYRNTATAPSLGYRIVEVIRVLEPLPVSSFEVPWNPGVFRPDYRAVLERFGAREYVEEKGVKEFWIWGYHFGNLEPVESNMASPVTGDISNSERRNDDLPVYGSTYVLYNYNFTRSANEAVHNHGHQLEAILGHANQTRDLEVSGKDLFWRDFVGRDESGGFVTGRCGWTHMPPNTTVDYDYANPALAESDCEDWTPAGTGSKKLANRDTWGTLPYAWPGGRKPHAGVEAQWYIYWMQNMPGKDNGIRHPEADRPELGEASLTNWWRFTGDWDRYIAAGPGLVQHSAAPGTPLAHLLADPVSGTAPLAVRLDASGSSDPQGEPLEYRFVFGDGAELSSASPLADHTYGSPGTYRARVAVEDPGGSVSEASLEILVEAASGGQPTAVISHTRVSDFAVNFDGTASFDPEGSPLSYAWDFGDGGTWNTGPLVGHSFPGEGDYTVTLTVTDADGLQGQASVVLAIRRENTPYALLRAVPSRGPAPLLVSFDASESFDPNGDPLRYLWDFKDGSTDSTESPSIDHLYTAPGRYLARVRVEDPSGLFMESVVEILVESGGAAPSAALAADPTYGKAPLLVVLDASGSSDPEGGPLAFHWDFGDGETVSTSEPVVAHEYLATGEYPARVEVSDPEGRSSEASVTISVLSPGEEIVLNGSFEEGKEPWQGKGGVVSGAAPEGGASAWRITGRTEKYHGPYQDVTPRISAQSTYTGSFWIRVEKKTDRARLRLIYEDKTGRHGIDLAFIEDPPVGVWVEGRGTAALSWTGRLQYVQVRVDTVGPEVNGEYPRFMADRVSVRTAPAASFDDDCEENDRRAEACDLGALDGSLARSNLYIFNGARDPAEKGAAAGDLDFYRFEVGREGRVRIRVTPSWGEGDMALELQDDRGRLLAKSDFRNRSDEQIVKRLAPGEYTLKVSQGGENAEAFYRMELEEIAPETAVDLIMNGSFEEGKSFWKGKGFVSDDAVDGASSLRVTERTEGYHGPQQDVAARIDSGLTYIASLWMKIDRASDRALLRLVYEDSEGQHTMNLVRVDHPRPGRWFRMAGETEVSWKGKLKWAEIRASVRGEKKRGEYPSFRTDAIEVKAVEKP